MPPSSLKAAITSPSPDASQGGVHRGKSHLYRARQLTANRELKDLQTSEKNPSQGANCTQTAHFSEIRRVTPNQAGKNPIRSRRRTSGRTRNNPIVRNPGAAASTRAAQKAKRKRPEKEKQWGREMESARRWRSTEERLTLHRPAARRW